MKKYLKIPVYEHPNLDYAEWVKSNEYSNPGFHTLKDSTGTYLRCGGASNSFISSTDFPSAMMLFEYRETEPIAIEPPVRGVSENTLLKALAIAQDPTLALNLLK